MTETCPWAIKANHIYCEDGFPDYFCDNRKSEHYGKKCVGGCVLEPEVFLLNNGKPVAMITVEKDKMVELEEKIEFDAYRVVYR